MQRVWQLPSFQNQRHRTPGDPKKTIPGYCLCTATVPAGRIGVLFYLEDTRPLRHVDAYWIAWCAVTLVLERRKLPYALHSRPRLKEAGGRAGAYDYFGHATQSHLHRALGTFPVKIEYISRFKSDKEIKTILKEVHEGNVNIIIGTHRVVSRDVSSKTWVLLVIDEEQKFGC